MFRSNYGGFVNDVNGTVASLAARVTALEDAPIKSTYFQVVEATTGTITPPSGATILLDQFASSVDALVSEIDANGHPTFQTPQTSGGTYIAATLDASGNYTLTGTPASAEVAIIYVYSIARKNFDISESIGFEETNLFTNSDKQVITSAWVNGGNAFGAAATIGTNDAFDFTIKAHNSSAISVNETSVNILYSTASTSTITGALTVAGGVGIAGAINAANGTDTTFTFGQAKIGSPTTSRAFFAHTNHLSNTNYALMQDNSADTFISAASGRTIYFKNGGGTNTTNIANVNSSSLNVSVTTASTSTGTGALVVAGGVGVGGNVYIGGKVQAAGYKSSDGSDGASGTWTTTDGKTITAKDGLITSIV